jgi:hypothetical protein
MVLNQMLFKFTAVSDFLSVASLDATVKLCTSGISLPFGGIERTSSPASNQLIRAVLKQLRYLSS